MDKKFSSNFFFKEPIVHGANLALIALSKFLEKKEKNIFIKKISFDFKNFLLVNEKFKIKVYKNKILIISEINTKLEIKIKYTIQKIDRKNLNTGIQYKFYKNKFKKLVNKNLINHIIYISYLVGSIKPGNGSLIHKLILEYKDKDKLNKIPLFVKKTKNLFEIDYHKNFFSTYALASKLQPFNQKTKKLKFSKKSLKNLESKKILIFGSNSDLGKRINCLPFKKKKFKIYNHSFRVNFDRHKIGSLEKRN